MIRPQYHFRKVGDDTHIWDVRKLATLAASLPVRNIPLADIHEIDEPYWFAATDGIPTCRAVIGHASQVAAADLACPVLLCAQGRVMDGMHRIMKAHGRDHTTISGRRFGQTPPPDFVNVAPDALPY